MLRAVSSLRRLAWRQDRLEHSFIAGSPGRPDLRAAWHIIFGAHELLGESRAIWLGR